MKTIDQIGELASIVVHGDLTIGPDQIVITASKPLSIVVENDIYIADSATIDASAVGTIAGPGGGSPDTNVGAGGIGVGFNNLVVNAHNAMGGSGGLSAYPGYPRDTGGMPGGPGQLGLIDLKMDGYTRTSAATLQSVQGTCGLIGFNSADRNSVYNLPYLDNTTGIAFGPDGSMFVAKGTVIVRYRKRQRRHHCLH